MIRSSRTYHGSAMWPAIASTSSSSDAIGATGSPSTGSPRTGAGGKRAAEVERGADLRGQRRHASVESCGLSRDTSTLARLGALAALGREQRLRARPLRRRQHRQRITQRLARLVVEPPALEPGERLALDVGRLVGERERRGDGRAAGPVEQLQRRAHGLLRRRRPGPARGRARRERVDEREFLDRETDHRRRRRAQQRRERVHPLRALGALTRSARQNFVYQLAR